MIIVPCKNDERNFIVEMVESVIRFHPNERVVIVDSNSANKDYFSKVQHDNVIIEDIGNMYFVDGAIWHCYEKYTQEKFFYVLHDSMILKQSLDGFRNQLFTAICHFPENFYLPEIESYCRTMDIKTHYKFKPSGWHGLMGIAFLCQREILTRLRNKNLHFMLPIDKIQMQGSERIWGMALAQENVDISQNTVCGKPYIPGFYLDVINDNPYFYKRFPMRE